FFEHPAKIRKIIYTTNTIENLNRNIRKITKTKDLLQHKQLWLN
ncbi:MAG: transposase, partial [Malacoplasma sp.]|nr:transposase [Malacoplasma sp.]